MEIPQRVIDRILARVDHSDPDSCWLWPGSTLSSGYGHISWSVNGKMIYRVVHRVTYMALVGPIPDGLDLDHTCHDPRVCHPEIAADCVHRRCCNPAHLEPVDRQTNLLRGGTVAARRAAVTECPQGHPYDAENTWTDKYGRRNCRTCFRDRNREAARKRRKAHQMGSAEHEQ